MSYPEKFHSIFARNCEIRRIEKDVAADFLNRHHLYGDCAAKYRYGIYVRRYSGIENKDGYGEHSYPVGSLVAVASFSNARRWDKGGHIITSYEWLRYASLPEVRVIGGMGRILKTFIAEVNPDDIMSYAPLDHYLGEVYETLGFVREGTKTFNGPDGSSSTSIKFRLKLTDYTTDTQRQTNGTDTTDTQRQTNGTDTTDTQRRTNGTDTTDTQRRTNGTDTTDTQRRTTDTDTTETTDTQGRTTGTDTTDTQGRTTDQQEDIKQ